MKHLVARFSLVSTLIVSLAGCGAGTTSDSTPPEATSPSLDRGLVLALAVLDTVDGKPVPQPAQLGFLSNSGHGWTYTTLDDSASNVFHKAMAYSTAGGEPSLLSAGGTTAIVKLWQPDGSAQVLWEKDFGGKFSRMRDLEVGDIYGDGTAAIAVATHDQGVVAVLKPDGNGGFEVNELDREPNTIVHEVEIGDLDNDGVLEIYATPSLPNKLDGSPQPGSVVRYVPAKGEGRTLVADLGDQHAKEILVADVDGDGTDELYVSVEAVAGGQVEIRRYDAGTEPTGGQVITRLDDKLCRFLTAGDVDGDGSLEIVAAAHKSGLWLLRPGAEPEAEWSRTAIDRSSGGFEHASILTDLDGDGRDELYVANDKGREVNRYLFQDGAFVKEQLYAYTDTMSRFTWNIMPMAVSLIPGEN